MSITVDKEFEALIPPLSPEEFQQLEENCLSEGIRDALITWNGILIDGHNRFRIAAKHGLKWTEKQMNFADREDAVRWIIRNQLGRRNLSLYDRSILALRLKPAIAEKAKDKQSEAGGAVRQKSDKAVVDTKKELAKVAGVSHDTIHKVETIQNSGDQKLIDGVRSGETSINRAYQVVKGTEIKTKPPAQAKREYLETAHNEHEQFKEKKVVTLEDIKADKDNRHTLARDQYMKLLNMGKKIEEVGMSIQEGDFDIYTMAKELSFEERKTLLDLIGFWRKELSLIAQTMVNGKQ